ncbi:MAG: response regulator [Eubacteriales bacterium]|nr:response regulator [Eubacteriales bacterium]
MTKILIVDDSVFSQQVLSNLLKTNLEDIEVFYANNGEEGIMKYLEIKPDYIFTDLLMPKLNGSDFIKLVKEYDKAAKIIVLSADVQKNIREEVEELGICLFFNKPFNQEKAVQVRDMIRSHNHD